MDIISYILSRKYTDNSIVGLGAIKGANCIVKDIVHQDGINTVTFEWVGTDGTTKTRDMVVYDGTPIYVWESGNTYHYGDLAIYESQFYRCIVENNDAVFDNTKWNEIGSPDGNYDIVQSKALLPARFTAADRKLYFVIDEHIFYLWDGTQWVGQTCLVQEETMPIASAKYLGRIYQYIGTTDTSFVHGYCYECVSDGANPPTYSWVSVGNSPIFTGTQAQWDSLTLAQQNVYKFVNIIGDEQNINLGIYLRKVNSMPNAEDCPSETVMYVGTTTANYVKGYIYCSVPSVVNGETVYNWVRQDAQPYIQADWEQTNSSAHDYIKHKPILGTASAKNYTSNVRPNNTDLVESQAVYSAINNALSSIYVPRGELSCAELTADLLIPANIGNVYTMSDSGTTSALFINGAGHPIAVNDNVGIIRAGEDTILFNLMGNAFDLHDYQTKELETPLIIDGTQETEVEDALSGLNEGLNNRVTYEYQGKMGAKNLLVYPYYRPNPTFNQSDIDFTANSDGSILVDGTASAYAGCDLALGTSYYKNIFTAGDYVISLNGISSNSNIRIQFRVYDSSTTPVTNLISVSTTKTVKKTSFTLTQEIVDKINNGTYNVNVRVFVGTAGDVVNNELCYPMICHAEDTDATWQPYAMTNYMLTKDMVKLNEIPIAKGTGNYSVIANTTASGNNTASGNYSFVEGYGSTASGNDSHAEGVSTVASATASHAEGYHSEASGLYSHAQNYHNIAQGRSQTVIGKYNTAQGTSDSIADTDYALIVGNGSDSSHRSNALALQWDGTVVFQDGTTQKTSPYKLMGELGAKNLLIYPYYIDSRTAYGITWDSTVTNDGRIVVDGQADAYSNYEMYYDGTSNSIDLKLKAGDYIASIGGCNNNENIMFRIRLVYPDPETGTTVTKANVTRQTQYKLEFNISDQEANDLANGIAHFEGRVYYPAASTEVFDNLIVSPMLRYAEDSSDIWQPYAKTNKELTDGLSNLVSTLNVTNISEKKIDITAFGGKADVNSSDNSQLLISAITYAMANGYTLYVPQGIYYIKSGVEITNDLKIEGVTTYGQSGQRVGSVIHFAPQANDVTMFYDNGSHNVSLRNVQFFCSYTHFTQSFEEVAESPHAYLTWSYDYTDVNCLNIPNSLIDIYNVGISGFSGYAIKCKSNRTINNVKIGACKYGFYDCGADVIFHDCYLSQCEYAFYWVTMGAVVFSYDTWIDLCGYGYYSEKEMSGEISGLIDHCLYAGIRAKHTQAGLNFNGRMGRCGMYYTGTDMLEFLSGAFTEEKFIEATKGVFVAIRDAKGLNLNINVYPRALDDQNLGENKLPTLICYGQKFESAIIKTSHNYGNHTYLVTNTAESHVNVINCDGSDTMVEFTAQELQAMW